MEWEKWRQRWESLFSVSTLTEVIREPFYIFTLNLLSLLLPLSFLLVSRLSRAQYVLSSYDPSSQFNSFLLSVFLFTNPSLLHILISFVSITALLHGLSSRTGFGIGISPPKGSSSLSRLPRLYLAWILLCTFQVCVGLGIEGTIAAGIWSMDYEEEEDALSKSRFVIRILFFLGLHETMVHWTRTFVKPVADDTVFGGAREERWVEKLMMGGSFGALWWWRLKDEVEGWLLVVDLKRDLSVGLAISDIVSWWLYCLTVTIGVVRLVRDFVWFGKTLLSRRREERSHDCSRGNDDKV